MTSTDRRLITAGMLREESELLDDAYETGRQEGERDARGLPHFSNPYRKGSREWQEWWLGWHAGMEGSHE